MVADVAQHHLVANVTVIARSDAQLGEAEMRGYTSSNNFQIMLKMSEAYLVNTIPATMVYKAN